MKSIRRLICALSASALLFVSSCDIYYRPPATEGKETTGTAEMTTEEKIIPEGETHTELFPDDRYHSVLSEIIDLLRESAEGAKKNKIITGQYEDPEKHEESKTEDKNTVPPESFFRNEVFREGVIYVNNSDYRLSPALSEKVYSLADTTDFITSFYVCDLVTGMSIGYNAREIIFAASLVKAPMGMYIMKLIDQGKASFDDILTYEEKYKMSGGGDIKYAEPGTKYKLKTVLEKMIGLSDNTAYKMIHDLYDYHGYNDMVERLGCNVWLDSYTKFGNFRASEMGAIWREIYRMSLESESGAWLMGELTKQNANKMTYFPSELLKKYKVANKAGWESLCQNDAGIVFAEHPYVVAVLTTKNGNKNKYNGENISSLILALDEVMHEYFDTLE